MANEILEKLTAEVTGNQVGRGAYRALAALLPVLSHDDIPMDRLKEFTIDWKTVENELVPQIRLSFHDDSGLNTKE